RNYFLMGASLFFYAWGEPWFVFVMLASIAMNWFAGLLIDRWRDSRRRRKLALACSVAINLGLLGVFKYADFMLSNLNLLLGTHLPLTRLMLPIGISFFTFQAMSYVIDVYRGDAPVQKQFSGVCLYVSLFPQLIAGPIVRYRTVAEEINHRRETFDDFSAGARRFVMGLCKKQLLANNLALLADAIYATPVASLSTANAWLGNLAYALQVYYDFSGYSDMGIGMGQMFGFHFLENFNYPYIATTVGEFWRRWHISMSTWFRDYLYIPLGGSRVSRGRWVLNMLVVWGLTGLWHGAKWTYIVWGLCFFAVLTVEKLAGIDKRWTRYIGLRRVYTLLIIFLTSAIIRADSLTYAAGFLGRLFSGGPIGLYDGAALENLNQYSAFLAMGVLFSMPVGKWLKEKLHIGDFWSRLIGNGLLAGGALLAISYAVLGSYNPFIYFNF
ncbi:MAG: MBOAT family protein, partial [Clostridiales bacterium]|nr:MBOAT family protein [Clostridiales bacterium]